MRLSSVVLAASLLLLLLLLLLLPRPANCITLAVRCASLCPPPKP